MARVVQKQKNPLLPVLVVFVFLFLISATLAIIFFNKADQAKAMQAKSEAALAKFATKRERKIPAIEALRKEAGTRKGNITAPSVVGALYKDNQDMSALILGSPADKMDQVETAVQTLRAKTKSNLSLLAEIENAYTRIAELKGQIKSIQDDRQVQIDTLEQARNKAKQLGQEVSSKVEALQSEKLKATQEADSAKKASMAKLSALQKENQKRLGELRKEGQKFVAKVQEQDLQIQQRDIRIDKLENELKGKKDKTGQTIMAIRPAGKIRRVFADHPVCFIPLGSKDKVVRGMTFRVYGPDGIPEDGTGAKASITVTDVLEYVSQCRVEPAPDASPILVGDYFANIAFDPTHQETFVVEGEFDLFGTGRPSKMGADQVKEIIERSGGKVADKLSVRTDYIVIGQAPVVPDKPEEDASEAVRQAYTTRLAASKRYSELLVKAAKMNIPILNTKRFLALTGYDPRKTLQ